MKRHLPFVLFIGGLALLATAFMFYQADQLQKIRVEMGPQASMGDAMTTVRWLS